MGKFVLKRFSIEDGGYSGNKRKTASGGYGSAMLIGGGLGAVAGGLSAPVPVAGGAALIGGVVGAGLGAWFNWLSNVADESEFNTDITTSCNSHKIIQAIEDYYSPDDPDEDERTVSSSTTLSDGRVVTSTRRVMNKKKEVISPSGLLYEIDKDPKKFVISMMLQGSVLVLYLNDLTKRELSIVNNILDSYCYNYRNADYSSQRCGKNSYVVDIKMLHDAEGAIPISLMKNGFKINILTSRSSRR